MGLPRSHYVQEGQVCVYHVFARCVRQAFLCGYDAVTGRDFSHRKTWLLDRLRVLSSIFALDVCAYAILATHYHIILRTRPDIAALWSDREVAIRWLTLFPNRRRKASPLLPPAEEHIRALTDSPERIALLRNRLSCLSWFMGQLNESIARAANKEDGVKGRFWESRFKCQALLDDPAVVAGMVYVDLNLLRAGLAPTPEQSNFTSIQERIRAWKIENLIHAAVPREATEAIPPDSPGNDIPTLISTNETSNPTPNIISTTRNAFAGQRSSDSWLCPIQSDATRRGILEMTAADYIDLVDRSGRLIRPDKRGAIDATLAPILQRIGARPEAWGETVSRFGSNFYLAVGVLSNLRRFADHLGRRWLKGVTAARTAFASAPPQLA